MTVRHVVVLEFVASVMEAGSGTMESPATTARVRRRVEPVAEAARGNADLGTRMHRVPRLAVCLLGRVLVQLWR